MAKVYVRLDENKTIVEINSSIFLNDTTDWVEIDEGEGDRYAHAQGNYFEGGLLDEQGRYKYKLYRNKVKERAEDEKEVAEQEPSRLDKLESKLETLEKLFELFKGVK